MEAAFRAQYVRLCIYARELVERGDTAEDIVSDVFVNVWERRGAWPARMRMYVHQAVRNRSLNHLKHARVVRKTEATVHEAGPVPGMAQPPASADTDVEAMELALAFKEAIERLPKRRRAAYMVRRQRGLSYAEVAEAMGTSTRTVETQVARADNALRRWLDPWM